MIPRPGGRATADLPVGATVPGGKLPVTFPAREADAPTATSPLRYPGVNGQEFYSEGIFVGYGLSYTSFGYRHLRVLPGHHRALPRVRLAVTNTGRRTGAEVAQVYVGRLPSGERRTVTVPPDRLSLSYWDSAADHGSPPPGGSGCRSGARRATSSCAAPSPSSSGG